VAFFYWVNISCEPKFPLTSIPEDQKSPLEQQLLDFIDHRFLQDGFGSG
jgi:hypothetical protein